MLEPRRAAAATAAAAPAAARRRRRRGLRLPPPFLSHFLFRRPAPEATQTGDRGRTLRGCVLVFASPIITISFCFFCCRWWWWWWWWWCWCSCNFSFFLLGLCAPRLRPRHPLRRLLLGFWSTWCAHGVRRRLRPPDPAAVPRSRRRAVRRRGRAPPRHARGHL